MENYENNTYPENAGETPAEEAVAEEETKEVEAEIIDAEIIDAETSAEEAEESADNTEAPDEEEDISLVAEKLSAMRNPLIHPQENTETKGDASSDPDIEEADKPKERIPDECGLFKGFTVKKALVTFAAVVLTVGILAATMAAAIAAAGDKTKRPSDFDLTYDTAALSEMRENAEKDIETVPDDEQTPTVEEKRFKVTLDFYDRDDVELYTTEMTLGDLLEESGIVLAEGEEAAIALDTVLEGATTVSFDKYEYTTASVTESVPYESDKRETDLIPRGTTNYIQYGTNGKVEKTYSVKLKNGEEVARELVNEETIEWPQSEIVEVGVGGSFVGADGKTYSYSYRKTVKATYYYIPDDPYTYLGNHPNSQTLAVDMSVIPLGTWMYVKNSRYDFGLRQAQDIGGAIKGDMIDIWLDGSEAGYSSFTREGVVYDMEVYFID